MVADRLANDFFFCQDRENGIKTLLICMDRRNVKSHHKSYAEGI